jgi:hypothetical protein
LLALLALEPGDLAAVLGNGAGGAAGLGADFFAGEAADFVLEDGGQSRHRVSPSITKVAKLGEMDI